MTERAQPTPLEAEILALIAAEGPIGIDRYMALALGHPVHGYYVTRDPLGAGGDFITAPEISQMFGELIGLWAAEVWTAMGAPARLRLIEWGPGRGTLIADALRAAAALPAFQNAIDLHLVETSPALRARQRAALAAIGWPEARVTWHAAPETVPDGPMIGVGNEFLDALPIRQFARARARWHERLVGLDTEGRLTFGLSPDPETSLTIPAPDGAVLEIAPAALGFTAGLARRLADQGGAALLIDYGDHVTPRFGDTLQALKDHAFVDPLATPGEADLTAHVDFAAIAQAARRAGAAVYGPVTQADCLEALGLSVRAAALKRRASPAQAAAIDAAVARLTDRTPTGMGALFKTLALSHPDLPVPPGFHEAG